MLMNIIINRLRLTGALVSRKLSDTANLQERRVFDDKLLADVYSFANRPPDLFLMPFKAGAKSSQLSTSPTREWLSFDWLVPEIVMIPASDGVKVPARIYRPSDMGAKPNGSAVIFVHGAGYLHNVVNYWSDYPREYMFNQFLASKGYVVLDADYRG